MLPDGSDLVAEEMNDWMDLNGMEFYIHYKRDTMYLSVIKCLPTLGQDNICYVIGLC